jgi:hypothetical protein
MDTDKHGLNTKVRNFVIPLSANEVGEEGRGEVARSIQIPSILPFRKPAREDARPTGTALLPFHPAFSLPLPGSAFRECRGEI